MKKKVEVVNEDVSETIKRVVMDIGMDFIKKLRKNPMVFMASDEVEEMFLESLQDVANRYMGMNGAVPSNRLQ